LRHVGSLEIVGIEILHRLLALAGCGGTTKNTQEKRETGKSSLDGMPPTL
jgi:hypothetical protein